MPECVVTADEILTRNDRAVKSDLPRGTMITFMGGEMLSNAYFNAAGKLVAASLLTPDGTRVISGLEALSTNWQSGVRVLELGPDSYQRAVEKFQRQCAKTPGL